jgi:hypothetical protein
MLGKRSHCLEAPAARVLRLDDRREIPFVLGDQQERALRNLGASACRQLGHEVARGVAP